MNWRAACIILMGLCFGLARESAAQLAPGIGYMFPPGGRAGSTIEVTLGGYDWTPDVEVFARDSSIGLDMTSIPGPVIVPRPPYWFGKKARRSPFLLPRETPARLTLPSGLDPGVYRWQVASANGVSASGKFYVSDLPELVEVPERSEPQELESLPVTVSGQIIRIEEVDRYRFTAPSDGPITLSTVATAIGSPLSAVIEVRDVSGRLIVDGADTAGRDLSVTFAAAAGQDYIASVYDVDFRGNRAFVYRLAIEPGPRVTATVPALVQREATQDVTFIGVGIATGAAELESITQTITAVESGEFMTGQFETSSGQPVPYRLPLSDVTETVRSKDAIQKVELPVAVTGVLSKRFGIDRFRVTGAKGDIWSIDLQADAIHSPLDVSLAVIDATGKELKRIDDIPGTTDAALEFRVPTDGDYELQVSDTSGNSGAIDAIYRLSVRPSEPGYTLTVPELVAVPTGGTAQLAIKAVRRNGFTGPIEIQVEGLPPGVSIPENPAIPEKKNDLRLTLTAAEDAGTVAGMITITGRSMIEETAIEHRAEPTLLAVTMKPPFSIDAEGKNDVTKWPRGSTFPAPVLIERDESFNAEIVLEMSSRQGRHRQGIRGPEMTIPPEADRVLYPVFLPEWLETTRTSRMVVNGVTRVKDPRGRERYLSSRLVTRLGFLPTGALLKVSTPLTELEVPAGEPFEVPLNVFRAQELENSAELQLVLDDAMSGRLQADAITIKERSASLAMNIEPAEGVFFPEEVELRVQATATWHGHPVVSETTLLVVFTGQTD